MEEYVKMIWNPGFFIIDNSIIRNEIPLKSDRAVEIPRGPNRIESKQAANTHSGRSFGGPHLNPLRSNPPDFLLLLL